MDTGYRKDKISRMRALILAVIAALGLLVGGTTDPQAQSPARTTTPYATGELLVKYKPAFQSQASDAHLRRWGISTLKVFKTQGLHRVKLPAAMSVHNALELFRQDPQVEFAEPNYYRHLRATTPNDPDYSQLWALPKINAPGGWDLATDCSTTVVGLIDSGVDYTHPDLAANIWTNPGDIAPMALTMTATAKSMIRADGILFTMTTTPWTPTATAPMWPGLSVRLATTPWE